MSAELQILLLQLGAQLLVLVLGFLAGWNWPEIRAFLAELWERDLWG